MKTLVTLFLVGFTAGVRVCGQTNPVAANAVSGPAVEKIICIRHGEKQTNAYGQLTCKGFNRALALPGVLAGYGPPQFIFAPNPLQRTETKGVCNYIRPLATIEPTAVRYGLPVNTQFAFDDIADLEKELMKEDYKTSTVFIAWEHKELRKFVEKIVKDNNGNFDKVPTNWPGGDYDSIYIVEITRSAGRVSAVFTKSSEGLNDSLSEDCPGTSTKK